MILPTGADDRRMTTSKRQTLVDFMFYSLCEGQSKAGAYGYSPLPLNLVAAGFTQLTKLGQADPGVDIAHRDATRCNNPTFVKGDLTRNHLAEIAPSPAACDKVGAGPCGAVPEATTSGSGATTTTTAGPRTAAAGSAGSAGGSARGAAGSSGAAAGSGSGQAGTVDPETGATVGTTSLTGAQPVAGQAASDAVPVELGAARSPEGTNVFGVLAVIELVALVLAPGLVTLAIRRSTAAGARHGV
jgi:phosphate transport system substrate-binding protein